MYIIPFIPTQRSELIFGTAPPLSGTLMLLFCQLPFASLANLACLVILAILTLTLLVVTALPPLKSVADTFLRLFHIQSIKFISLCSLSIAKGLYIQWRHSYIQSSKPPSHSFALPLSMDDQLLSSSFS